MLVKLNNAGFSPTEEIPESFLQGLTEISTQPTTAQPIETKTLSDLDKLKAQIAEITKQITEKQNLITKISRAGFSPTEEIPDWLLQGLPKPTQTTKKSTVPITSGGSSSGGLISGGISSGFGTGSFSNIAITITSNVTITQSILVAETNNRPTSNDEVTNATNGLNPLKITLSNTGSSPSPYRMRLNPIREYSGHVQLWVKYFDDWYDINFIGWGSASGFVMPANYTGVLEVYAISNEATVYPLTFTLATSDSPSTIIATTTGIITVLPTCSPSCGSHGTCTDTNVCTCSDGYTGSTCSTAPVVPLAPTCSPPCPVHGTCTNTNTCTCQNGYTGATCDTVDPSVSGNFSLNSGSQTYTITGGHRSPNFTQAIVDPLNVAVGDTQTMTVKISDTYEITSVEARVETDTGIDVYSLPLVSGTTLDGTWQGSWVVHDTHLTTYRTTFYAIDSNNESGEIILTWSDACTIPYSGTWTLSGPCAVVGGGVVVGISGASINLNGQTLTLNAGATFYFESGQSITMGGGSIAKGSGASITKLSAPNYLYIADADSDGYPPSATLYTSSGTGRVRRNTLTNFIQYSDNTGLKIDYNDDSASIYPGTVCNAEPGDDCSYNTDSGGCGSAPVGTDVSLALCKKCDGISAYSVYIANGVQDLLGSNTCSTTHYVCNGSGTCSAPTAITSCLAAGTGTTCDTFCSTNYSSCGTAYTVLDCRATSAVTCASSGLRYCKCNYYLY